MFNIIDGFKKNPLPYLVQVVSVVALIIALYVTSRLAPLSKDLAILKTEVHASENGKITQEDFFTLKEKVSNVDSRTARMEEKLDRALGI